MEFFHLPYYTVKGTTTTSTTASLMEQDLIGRVGEDYCTNNSYNNLVDCTLSLGGGGGGGGGGSSSSSSSSSSSAFKGGMRALFGKGGHATSSTRSMQSGVLKRCSKCFRTETPLWRNGPNGAKSLCNACGIRYKKEEKRVQLVLWPVSPHGKTKAYK